VEVPVPLLELVDTAVVVVDVGLAIVDVIETDAVVELVPELEGLVLVDEPLVAVVVSRVVELLPAELSMVVLEVVIELELAVEVVAPVLVVEVKADMVDIDELEVGKVVSVELVVGSDVEVLDVID
jgi:hypothetical protein